MAGMVLVGIMIVGGVALGYLRGGRLCHLGATPLRWPALVGVAVAGQLTLRGPASTTGLVRTGVLAAIGAALIEFAWANRMRPGMGLILLGFGLNALVITVNSGMPVSGAALDAIGQSRTLARHDQHQVLRASDRLGFLGDVLPVPALRSIYSLGDIAVAAGMGTLVANLMRPGPAPSRAAAIPRSSPSPRGDSCRVSSPAWRRRGRRPRRCAAARRSAPAPAERATGSP